MGRDNVCAPIYIQHTHKTQSHIINYTTTKIIITSTLTILLLSQYFWEKILTQQKKRKKKYKKQKYLNKLKLVLKMSCLCAMFVHVCIKIN